MSSLYIFFLLPFCCHHCHCYGWKRYRSQHSGASRIFHLEKRYLNHRVDVRESCVVCSFSRYRRRLCCWCHRCRLCSRAVICNVHVCNQSKNSNSNIWCERQYDSSTLSRGHRIPNEGGSFSFASSFLLFAFRSFYVVCFLSLFLHSASCFVCVCADSVEHLAPTAEWKIFNKTRNEDWRRWECTYDVQRTKTPLATLK